MVFGAAPSLAADSTGFAAKPEVELILAQYDPDNSLPGLLCHRWADLVFQNSKGRIKVLVNSGGSLAKPNEVLSKIRSGAIDVAYGQPSMFPGQFKITDGLTLPYLPYKSSAHASQVMFDIWDKTDLLKGDPGWGGVKVIQVRANCDAPIITAKRKLNRVEDLKGMAIRATAAPLVNWLSVFGATGRNCPITELFLNLQNGAFDGAITDWHAVETYRLYECAKFFADEGLMYNSAFIIMNPAKYNSLSADNKKAIDMSSGQAAVDVIKDAWDNLKATAIKSVAATGGETYKLPAAEHKKLVDAASKITQQWIAENGPTAQRLYDKILELCK